MPVGALPEVGAEDGAFPGPGDEGEDDVAGVGAGVALDAAHEVVNQVLEGVEAEACLSHAGREHGGHVREDLAPVGLFGGVGLIELAAELHGEVAEFEDGEDGLEPAAEGFDLAAEVAERVHIGSSLDGSWGLRY